MSEVLTGFKNSIESEIPNFSKDTWYKNFNWYKWFKYILLSGFLILALKPCDKIVEYTDAHRGYWYAKGKLLLPIVAGFLLIPVAIISVAIMLATLVALLPISIIIATIASIAGWFFALFKCIKGLVESPYDFGRGEMSGSASVTIIALSILAATIMFPFVLIYKAITEWIIPLIKTTWGMLETMGFILTFIPLLILSPVKELVEELPPWPKTLCVGALLAATAAILVASGAFATITVPAALTLSMIPAMAIAGALAFFACMGAIIISLSIVDGIALFTDNKVPDTPEKPWSVLNFALFISTLPMLAAPICVAAGAISIAELSSLVLGAITLLASSGLAFLIAPAAAFIIGMSLTATWCVARAQIFKGNEGLTSGSPNPNGTPGEELTGVNPTGSPVAAAEKLTENTLHPQDNQLPNDAPVSQPPAKQIAPASSPK